MEVTNQLPTEKYDAVILAVAHKDFEKLDLKRLKSDNAVIYDVKSFLPPHAYDQRL